MNPTVDVAPFDQTTRAGLSHLRRLVVLRGIAIGVQSATLTWAYYFLEMELQWLPMLVTIALLVLLNIFTGWRLRSNSGPVTHPELFAQLCADVLSLSVLLYYGGGSANPFIS